MVWSAFSRSGWNPWAELSRMQSELDRLFADGARPASDEFPPVDVWSGEQGLRVHAQLPGFDPAEIDVSVVGDTLTIRGSRPEEQRESGTWHRRERGSGSFARTLQLPYAIEVDAVAASFANGVLSIDLPRAASDKPRRIAVAAS